jgi:hypothetical protein
MSKTEQYSYALSGMLAHRAVPCSFEGFLGDPLRIGCEIVPYGALQCSRAGEFFTSLSPEASGDFQSLESLNDYPGSTILFLVGETPSRVLILREGQSKLSINSIGGKRLILGIARPTEILGLTSALSGDPYEVTAETFTGWSSRPFRFRIPTSA